MHNGIKFRLWGHAFELLQFRQHHMHIVFKSSLYYAPGL